MMETELKKDSVGAVEVSTDQKTGKLNIKVHIDPAKVDDAMREYLKKLAGRPASEVLSQLGSKSVENLQKSLNEDIMLRLGQRSRELAALGGKKK